MKLLWLALLALLPAHCCFAEGYVGGMIGPALNNNPNGAYFALGIEGGLKVIPQLGLGLYESVAFLDITDTSSTTSISTEQVLAFKPTYFINGDDSGPTVGAIIGMGVLTNRTLYSSGGFSNNSSMTSNSSVSLAVGASAGYEFILTQNFALDPQANWVFIHGAGGNSSSRMLALMASAKFIF